MASSPSLVTKTSPSAMAWIIASSTSLFRAASRSLAAILVITVRVRYRVSRIDVINAAKSACINAVFLQGPLVVGRFSG